MNTALSALNILVIARLCTLSLGGDASHQGSFSPMLVDRERRSAKAIQNRLCPPEVSRENCFVNQLLVYMRMQDSLLDPVSLRNIGKRSGAQPPSVKLLGSDAAPWELYDRPITAGSSIPGHLDNEQLQGMMKDLKNNDYESDAFDNFSAESKRNTPNDISNGGAYSTVQKRQIICPNGMSRIKCYNNALAFYMRLLRTVKEK